MLTNLLGSNDHFILYVPTNDVDDRRKEMIKSLMDFRDIFAS